MTKPSRSQPPGDQERVAPLGWRMLRCQYIAASALVAEISQLGDAELAEQALDLAEALHHPPLRAFLVERARLLSVELARRLLEVPQ